MHLVLGLGNPGRRYERTRHNAGFLVVDRLATRHGTSLDRKHLGALVASVRIGEHPVVLAKPQGFMNVSGQPAASLRGYYKVANDDVVVVHDECDLPFGDVRVKKGGGAAGHNGVRDVAEKLGTQGFVRVRFGVGRPPEGWDRADWVLSGFTSDEEARLDALVDRAADAVEAVVVQGVERAMNTFNTRAVSGQPSAVSTDGPAES